MGGKCVSVQSEQLDDIFQTSDKKMESLCATERELWDGGNGATRGTHRHAPVTVDRRTPGRPRVLGSLKKIKC